MLALFFCLSYPTLAQQSRETPLTNAAVIKLVRAGFKEKTVIAIIRSRPAHQQTLRAKQVFYARARGGNDGGGGTEMILPGT